MDMRYNDEKTPELKNQLRSHDYDIGYQKPPIKTQFKPGKSGNPKGRPRGSKNLISPREETRLADIISRVGSQIISVQEKNKIIQIPLEEAVVRSLIVKAAKGDTKSQQIFLNMKEKIDLKREKEITEAVDVATQYKVFWERTFEQQKLQNIPLSDPIPHPDDIIVNLETGHIHMEGPMDRKEKEEWDNMLKMYAEMEDSILDLKEQLLDSKNQNDRELIESCLRQESKLFDIAYKAVGNKAYVTRNKSKYRKKLMN